jgi:ribosomal protein S18 acetylase RimI-like enzyme
MCSRFFIRLPKARVVHERLPALPSRLRPPRCAILEHMRDCHLQLARISEAGSLAQMSRTLIELGLGHSWTAERIASQIQHPESIVLTAKLSDATAGFAAMQFADESAHLNLLAVAPPHRRRGVARALINWLEETACTAGTFTIGLELRATSDAAYAFYSALGYRETGRVRGYYQGVEDAIRMSRDLRNNCVTPTSKS